MLPSSAPPRVCSHVSWPCPARCAPRGTLGTLAAAGTPSRLNPAGGAALRCTALRAGLDEDLARRLLSGVASLLGADRTDQEAQTRHPPTRVRLIRKWLLYA